jgi:hypothetical protein
MLWLYRRDDEMCPVEASFDSAAQQYVLVIYKGLPNECWERFTDEAAFRTRLSDPRARDVHRQLEHSGPPVFLKDGWKL